MDGACDACGEAPPRIHDHDVRSRHQADALDVQVREGRAGERHGPRVPEQIEVALFGGEYQEGVLTAYCSIEDVPHIELNGHILVPLQNVASLHWSSLPNIG